MYWMPSFLGKHEAVIPVGVLFMIILCITSPIIRLSDNLTFCHILYLNETPSPHRLHPSYLTSYPPCLISKAVPSLNAYLLHSYG